MKKFSRYPLFLALLLVLLMTACGAGQGTTPTPMGTILSPGTELASSTPFGPTETIGTTPTASGPELIVTPDNTTGVLETATVTGGGLITTPMGGTPAPTVGVTRTPGIPVTGQEIMLVECQFCVDTRAHALLVLPDTATFQITSPAVSSTTTTDVQPTCTTVEINNGSQVVLCSGPEMTPLVVNICTDASHCTDFPVNLLACPLAQGSPANPAATQAPGTGGTGGIAPTATTSGGAVIITATPGTGTAATATTAP